MLSVIPWVLVIVLMIGAGVQGQTALVNPGFEQPNAQADPAPRPERVRVAEGWLSWLSFGPACGSVRLTNEAHSGKSALEMQVAGDDPAKYNIETQQSIPARPGQTVRVRFFAKRKGAIRGWAGLHFFDAAGKRTGAEGSVAVRPGLEYMAFEMKQVTPPDAARMALLFRVLSAQVPAPGASIIVDDVEVSFDAADTLQNSRLVVRIDPVYGGRVRSMTLRTGAGMREALLWLGPETGGAAQTMLPAGKGEFLFNRPFAIEVIEPLRKARLSTTLDFAEPARKAFNGLRIEKTLSLPPDEPRLDVHLRLVNTTDHRLEVPMRERHCLPPRPAHWSWPFNDWLKALDRTEGQALTQVRTTLGRGWIGAMRGDGLGVAVAFDPATAQEAYSYFCSDVDTLEWYYVPVGLPPGGAWETSYSIWLIEDRGLLFGANRDAVFVAETTPEKIVAVRAHGATGATGVAVALEGKAVARSDARAGIAGFVLDAPVTKAVTVSSAAQNPAFVIGGAGEGRVQWIKPVALPPPPPTVRLPSFFTRVFPFFTAADFLYYGEGAGGGDRYVNYMTRLPREARYAYFNGIMGGRLTQEEYVSKLFAPDGRNAYAGSAQRYGLFLSDFTSYLGKTEESTQRRFFSVLERKGAVLPPSFRRICDAAPGLVPFLVISDEPPPSQIAQMSQVLAQLRKERPDIVCFPVINLNLFDFGPYVPVYCGDHYPIKSAAFGGRNPWSVGPTIRKAVRAARTSPVWLLAQGFGYARADLYGDSPEAREAAGTGQYILPSAGEMRLMVNLAVANGAKGINVYGMGRLSWRYKYWYFQTVCDNAGATTPAFEAASDAARILTAVGPCLLQTAPDDATSGVTVKSDDIALAPFYSGPALVPFVLKPYQGAGRFVCVVNMDPGREQRGEVTLTADGGAAQELTTMRNPAGAPSDRITLLPGGMALYYSGPADEAKAIWDRARAGYARNELDRLRIDVDRAEANGLPQHATAALMAKAEEELAAGRPEEAWQRVSSARKAHEVSLKGTELAACMQSLADDRRRLSRAAAQFRDHFERFVPLAVYVRTERSARFNNLEQPQAQSLVDAVAADFVDFWRLEREIWDGRCATAAPQVKELTARVQRHAESVDEFLVDAPRRP